MSALYIILVVQVVTNVALGGLFWHQGQWRLALAQFLLAVVTAVIYSGSME